MRFFFDRCAPIGIARMVRAIEGDELLIRHHDEDKRFSDKTTDIEWMKAIRDDGDPTWVVISGDGRILKNKAERLVLDEVGLRFFCLDGAWPRMQIYEYAWKFMKVWPNIIERAGQKKGRIFRIGTGAALKIEVLAD
jgi:hypothetical protein